MIKTLSEAEKAERTKFKMPRSVQDSIPVSEIYGDGVWHVGRKYSRTWRFSDINYVSAADEDRKRVIRTYGGILSSLPAGATVKLTIVNHRLNEKEFQRTMLMPGRGDGNDRFRGELNGILTATAADSKNLVQDKYITMSIPDKKLADARAFFRREDGDLAKSFARLNSTIRPINNHDRLRIFHDFFRPGEESEFTYDVTRMARRGMDFKDIICPDNLSFKRDHFEMGGKVGRVLFLREYGSYVKDEAIANLSDFAQNLVLSIDMIAVPTDEAIKEVNQRILGVEADITRWQQRQNSRNNFSATPPRELTQARDENVEYLDDITTRDQRMILVLITLVHVADTLEQLDADTESIRAIATEGNCNFAVLGEQQEDGLNTVLPYGLRRIRTVRTLTTESVAALVPFRTRDIQERGGIYYGVNAISKNLLICDRKQLVSPHAFYLGVSGSGKSVGMKFTAFNVACSTDDDIIIVDAEREYGPMVRALGGEVVEISPQSKRHINPLEVSAGYEDNDVIAMKTELVTSILEQHMGPGSLTANHKSIIDRCTKKVMQSYVRKRRKTAPTLNDWRNEVLKQSDPEARDLALASELITEGSLNIFSHSSNVNTDNRIICYDLYEMGDQLRPTALVVTLDAIQNRVIANRAKGKYTWVLIDEVYLYFKYHYSSEVLYRAWKRFRKYGGVLTAATQNVEECLASDTARLMFANSEFLLLFNQAASDRQALANLLNISDTEMSYVTDAEPGHGLLRMAGSVVPFANDIPRDTELYRLMSTTLGEG